MNIELSEILVCPACGPDANLVLAVDQAEGRWVRSGMLACARCDRRYPVGSGLVDFTDGGTSEGAVTEEVADGSQGSPEVRSEDPQELATEVAALLELQRRSGTILLGPGLEPVAPRVASMAERAEILAVSPGAGEDSRASTVRDGEGGEGQRGRFTRLVTPDVELLPVRERRLAGVALWSPDPARLEDAVPALGPGGRLLGLRPGPDARRAAEGLELEVLASEERAFLLRRPA